MNSEEHAYSLDNILQTVQITNLSIINTYMPPAVNLSDLRGKRVILSQPIILLHFCANITFFEFALATAPLEKIALCCTSILVLNIHNF